MAQRASAASAHPESSVRTPVPSRGSYSTSGFFQGLGGPVYPAASAVSSQPGRGVLTSAPHRRSGNTEAEAWRNALECFPAGAWCAALAVTTLQHSSRAECPASWYRVAHSQGGESSLLRRGSPPCQTGGTGGEQHRDAQKCDDAIWRELLRGAQSPALSA